jgi:hypothetical protein
MNRPAEILDGLVDLEEVSSAILGPEAVVFLLEASKGTHAALRQGVSLDPFYPKVRRCLLERVVEEVEGLLVVLGLLRVPVSFEGFQCLLPMTEIRVYSMAS